VSRSWITFAVLSTRRAIPARSWESRLNGWAGVDMSLPRRLEGTEWRLPIDEWPLSIDMLTRSYFSFSLDQSLSSAHTASVCANALMLVIRCQDQGTQVFDCRLRCW
jgi:hypothetical protein